jgi:hypothetical protein
MSHLTEPRRTALAAIFATFATVAIAATLTLVLAGCQDTREPSGVEPPTGGGPPYEARLSPDAVWSNAEVALEALDPFGWEDQLSPTFAFDPSGATASQFPDVDWASWGRDEDVAVIRALASGADSVRADLRSLVLEAPDPVGGQVQWDLIYEVLVFNRDDSTTRFRGRALLDFALEGAEWRLARWDDLQGESPPDDPTILLPPLGDLRGALAGAL